MNKCLDYDEIDKKEFYEAARNIKIGSKNQDYSAKSPEIPGKHDVILVNSCYLKKYRLWRSKSECNITLSLYHLKFKICTSLLKKKKQTL